MINREQIYQALFERLEALPSFEVAERRFKAWTEVDASDLPALFLVQEKDEPVKERGVPAVWYLRPAVYIYGYTNPNDTSIVPSSVVNPLLDEVLHVGLKEDDTVDHVLTLGGLVSHCKPVMVDTVEGVQGSPAIAIITLQILVPDDY